MARVKLSLLAAAAVVAALGLTEGAGGAAGGMLHLVSSHRDDEPPGPGMGNLFFHGGAVELAPVVFLSYWGPEWQAGFRAGGYSSGQAQRYLEDFFGAVGGSSWIATTTQYCQGVPSGEESCVQAPASLHVSSPPSQLRGRWVDPTPVPREPTDADVEAAARRAVAHFGYSRDATYFVLTPAGKDAVGFGRSYCAYHGQTDQSSTPVAFAYLPYQPDAGRACGANLVNPGDDGFGHGEFDGFSINGGHEYAEAITNPDSDSAPGWLDAAGLEVADKCQPGVAGAQAGDVTLGGQVFAVQPLWSNVANGGRGGCVIGSS
jgi:hypothetical protein